MTILDDIAMLCRVIDAGDDSALAPLADALEEAGDARAAGLRRTEKHLPRPYGPRYWCWLAASGCERVNAQPDDADVLDDDLFARLRDVWSPVPHHAVYDTRSEALLALAEALTEVPHA